MDRDVGIDVLVERHADAVAGLEAGRHELARGGIDAGGEVAERERRGEADEGDGRGVTFGGAGHQDRQCRGPGPCG